MYPFSGCILRHVREDFVSPAKAPPCPFTQARLGTLRALTEDALSGEVVFLPDGAHTQCITWHILECILHPRPGHLLDTLKVQNVKRSGYIRLSDGVVVVPEAFPDDPEPEAARPPEPEENDFFDYLADMETRAREKRPVFCFGC